MLYLDSVRSFRGLTFYRDYSDPKTWFYLPNNPRLTREAGEPLFQLLIYRRDITDNPAFKEGDRPGGGFLTMTVDLGIPQSTLDAAKDELGSDVHLVPLQLEQGSVRVTTLGVSSGATAEEAAAGPRFVEKILGSTKPSLYGDNRAVFSVELSHEGAQLMRASLEDAGASQIAVVYDLEYRGLMPAYRVRIKIHFEQSYQYLRTRFTANTLWFKTDLDAEMEKLRKEGAIHIEEVDFTGMDPAAQAQSRERLNALAKELATWAFFKPALQPGTVLAVDRGNLVAADPTAAAQAVAAGFSQPLEAIASSRGAPGGTAGPRLPGQSGDERSARAGGRELPPTDGAPAEGGGAPPERELSAVERWNRAGRPQAAFLMRSLNQEERQDIEYNLFQVSATKRTIAPQGQIRLISGDPQLKGRIKEVDLGSPFFERISGTVRTSADLNALGVSSMTVKLRYGVRDDGTAPKDTMEATFTAAGQSKEYSFFMDRRFSMELEYQVVVNYKSGFALGDPTLDAVSPWIRTTTRDLDIDPGEVSAVFPVTLTQGQIDWTAITAVETRLDYDDPTPGAITTASTVIKQAVTDFTFRIRPRDLQRRAFRLSLKYLFAAGETVETKITGAGATAIVVNQPAQTAVPITVLASDPLQRFSKLMAELAYRPGAPRPDQEKLLTFTAGGETQTWTIFRASAQEKIEYDYRVTAIGKDGTQERGEWTKSGERFLTVGDVFEELLKVNVRLLVDNFQEAGLLGVRVKLLYRDAAPHSDPDKEIFFKAPAADAVPWVVPKKPGGRNQYEFTVTWIQKTGSMTTVGPRTTSDEELLLHPALLGE